ncbi:hypothetical protein FHW96_002331 [Novosphingobium sp. SG751A]|uniref:hypothetical protein n=1 Tax=Novosphingobium sp. SG751A TaxID=2587000 RepID=UPI001557911B|nr:hypothetical protein [Novosphingobium sp. SG751A]NOW46173.1 hypothetical protein [Novosphingobium sp. SG751A]
MSTAHIYAAGRPVRVTIRHHHESGSSSAETIDMARWSEMHIPLFNGLSVYFEEVTDADWQDKPALAPAPTPE